MSKEISRLKKLVFDTQAQNGFLRNRLQQLGFAEDMGCCTGDCPHEKLSLCAEALISEMKDISQFARNSLVFTPNEVRE